VTTSQPPVIVPEKPWYTSTTLWVNIAGGIVIILSILLDNAQILKLPDQAIAWLGVLLAIINGLLRFRTVQPVSLSQPSAVMLERKAFDSAVLRKVDLGATNIGGGPEARP
jgi:hypothetical protein